MRTAHLHKCKGAKELGILATSLGASSDLGLPGIHGGQWVTPLAATGALAHRACDSLWDPGADGTARGCLRGGGDSGWGGGMSMGKGHKKGQFCVKKKGGGDHHKVIFFSRCFPGCVGSFCCMRGGVALSVSKGRDQRTGEGHVPQYVLTSKYQAGLDGEQAKRVGSQVLV